MKLITGKTMIQKAMEVIPDFLSNINPRNIFNASKVYESWDELFDSEEYNELWSGYQGKESSAKVSRRFTFITAFRVDADPKTNYGKDFRLFKVYKSDGLQMIKEVEIGACLSSQPFRRVYVFDDSFALTDDYYDKSNPKARDYLKQVEAYVM